MTVLGPGHAVVAVDPDTCMSYGICTQVATVHFELDDDGVAHPLHPVVSAESLPLVERAEARCPSGAITVTRPASGQPPEERVE